MTSAPLVVANPAPDPARRRNVPAHGRHATPHRTRHAKCHPSLDTVLAAYAGGNFVGGRMGTSFGS